MDNTYSANGTRPLPGKPHPRNVDVYISDPPNEYSFNSRYGEYKDVPYFEEAKKAYLHKTLNRKHATGVNTWHEQLIAGRITPEDMKVLGYSNLARFSLLTHVILMQMTDERNPVSAQIIRAAMDAAKKSAPHSSDRDASATTQFRNTLDIAVKFGIETTLAVKNHESIMGFAQNSINPLRILDYEKGKKLVYYVDEFFTELRSAIPADTNITVIYRDDDYVHLMDKGVTPKEAAVSHVQGLSADRAIEAHDISRAVAEGVL